MDENGRSHNIQQLEYRPQLAYRMLQFGAQVLFPIFFSLRMYGRHNLPRSGGYIIGSNHQSFLDPVFLGLSVPRPISYLARRSLFRNKWFGRFLRNLNTIPIETSGVDVTGAKECIERLREGMALVLFPEGTRTSDGSLGKLSSGIAVVASRAEVPVVPAYIDGAFECWPRHSPFLRLAPVRVAFGPPISPIGTNKRAYRSFTGQLRKALESLRDQIRESWKNS